MAITAKPPDHHGLTAEINVTPMVDVMLELLIIFMVVTTTLPFTAQLPASGMGSRGDAEGAENR